MINSFVTFDGFTHVSNAEKVFEELPKINTMKTSVLDFLIVTVYPKSLTLSSLSLDILSELQTNISSNSLVD